MDYYSTVISVDQLAACLGQPGVNVVDCRFDLLAPGRGYQDYLAGHVPGAVYANLDHDLSAPVTADSGRHPLPRAEEFVQTLARLGIANGNQVIAYDGANGAIAARLWWMLRWLGHERVAVLDGGYAAWREQGQAIEPGPVQAAAGHFEAQERSDWVLDTAELVNALAHGPTPMLVDAREAARFKGEQEPIDRVAGHIPGARNLPLANSLDAHGQWRDAAELRDMWQSALAGTPPPGWAVMCGSGVTACHLALSAERAGLPPPRLYAGSWSEWIRDPGRPTVP